VSEGHVLVTGAAGFIGSRLTEKLLLEGRKVLALDCFLPNLYSAELKRERWRAFDEIKSGLLVKLEFDLRTDNFEALSKFEIDSVFNEAAMPGLNPDWSNFAPYYECNLSALNRLLEFVRKREVKSFVHASTSSVYGKSAVGDESQDLKPTSPYGVSKLAAEKLLLAYLEWFGIPVKILRYFSVYGPNQRPDMAYAKIIRAINCGEEFTIYGDGEQKRSNTFIDDIVEATILAETKAHEGDVMNLCGDDTISLNQAIQIIESTSGKKLKSRFVEGRTGDQRDTSGVNSLAKKILGWKARTGIAEGLEMQYKASLSS
jgi:nucleoside-diphosphate-sugar epimerase